MGRSYRVKNYNSWVKSAKRDYSYATFRKYLDLVFQYAGTASLSKELMPVGICWAKDIQAGDIIIKGGFPGHAETVVDVAENAAGKRIVLLAQSFMPAQEIEIFPEWIQSENEHYLVTPTWTFDARDTNARYLRRFRNEP